MPTNISILHWADWQATHKRQHLILVALSITDGSERLLFVRRVQAPYSEAMVNAHGCENSGVYWGYSKVVDRLLDVREGSSQ
jgi:hypothetical protein